MTLRRVIEHFRRQEWTAIAIDLVIVVVGVFIGMQVSNWNEERETRQRAAVFTERLREDLRREAWAYAKLYAYSQDVLSNADRALGALTGKRPLSDEQLVISAYRASQFRAITPRRATYDEMVSTGTVGLIADPKLRETALRVYVMPMMQRVSDEAKGSEYRALFRRTVDAQVQRSLLKNCGDSAIGGSIAYECKLDLPADEISQAAQALRGQPQLLPALQLRFADLETVLVDMKNSPEFLKNLGLVAGPKGIVQLDPPVRGRR